MSSGRWHDVLCAALVPLLWMMRVSQCTVTTLHVGMPPGTLLHGGPDSLARQFLVVLDDATNLTARQQLLRDVPGLQLHHFVPEHSFVATANHAGGSSDSCLDVPLIPCLASGAQDTAAQGGTVERSFPKKSHNRNVRWLTQSYREGKTPISKIKVDSVTNENLGLHGDKVTIALADTGLDTNNCFFVDSPPVPTADVGPNGSTGQVIGNAHRKLRGYLSYMDGRDSDYGHGTLVAGTAAGASVSRSHVGLLPFDSNAWKAHLLMIDIGCSGPGPCQCIDCDCARRVATKSTPSGHCAPDTTKSTVHPPDDWYERMLPWALINGATIFAAPWGDTGPAAVYSSHAHEIDKFTWENRYFLPIFSAGNDGASGFFSVSSAGAAKNVLTVGETMSSSAIEDSNAAFWSLHEEARQVRDELIAKHCGSTCTQCQTVECREALRFRPQTDQSNPDNCCQHTDRKVKARCCTITKQEIKAEGYLSDELKEKAELYYLEKKKSLENMRTRSGRGPTMDGRVKPDVVTVGDQIVSAKASSRTRSMSECGSATQADVLTQDSGASMSVGVVAAIAAQVQEYFESGWYPTGEKVTSDGFQPSAVLMKAMIIAMGKRLEGMIDMNGYGAWSKFSDGSNSVGQGGLLDGRPERWAFDISDPRYSIQSFQWLGTQGPNYFYGFGRIEEQVTLNFRPNVIDQMNVIVSGDSTRQGVICSTGVCVAPMYELVEVREGATSNLDALTKKDQLQPCPDSHREWRTTVKGPTDAGMQGGRSPGLNYCLRLRMRDPGNTAFVYSLAQGEAHARCIRVGGDDMELKATLVWNDYPATPGSGRALVNDLDLELIINGRLVHGNGKWSREKVGGNMESQRDDLNNVEQVVIPAGTFASGSIVMVAVKASRIIHGPQAYGLVITGRSMEFINPTQVSRGTDLCPVCVTGASKTCDEQHVNFSPGSMAWQICDETGRWGPCTVYFCRYGYEPMFKGLMPDCSKWLDQKMDFETETVAVDGNLAINATSAVDTTTEANTKADNRRAFFTTNSSSTNNLFAKVSFALTAQQVGINAHGLKNSRASAQRQKVMAELLAMPGDHEYTEQHSSDVHLITDDGVKSPKTLLQETNKGPENVSTGPVLQPSEGMSTGPALQPSTGPALQPSKSIPAAQIQDSQGLLTTLPGLPKAAHFMNDELHKRIVKKYHTHLQHQYLVHVQHAGDSIIMSSLASFGIFQPKIYSPHVFYVTMTYWSALQVSALSGILKVTAYGPQHKLPNNELPHRSTSPDHVTELLYVRLAHGAHVNAYRSAEEVRSLLAAAGVPVEGNHSGAHAHTGLPRNFSFTKVSVIHKNELLINTPERHLKLVSSLLSEHPDARWIEQYHPKVPHSNYARWIAQSNIPGQVEGTGQIPYWDMELDGRFIGDYTLDGIPPAGPYKYKGEEYVVQDTGLDIKNCFFFDPLSDPNYVSSSKHAEANFWDGHRKIMAYWDYMDSQDHIDGHGTHTVGMLVGSPQDSVQSGLQDFKGLTPKGKVYFMDVGCNSPKGCECHECDCSVYGRNNGSLSLCNTNDKRLHFPHCNFKDEGCEHGYYGIFRWSSLNDIDIHVQAYGSKSSSYAYGRDAADIDAFLYKFRKSKKVMIIAAGDDGNDVGYGSINGAALSKNAIIVGASQTSQKAYFQAVNQFSEAGSSGVYDSVRREEMEQVRDAFMKQQCSCDDDSCDSENSTLSQCALARELTTPEACCKSMYASFCCRWAKLAATSDTSRVPGAPDLPMYGLQNFHRKSSRGPISDRRILPHVTGLGAVTAARAMNMICRPQGTANLALVAREGTSVAAAHVAGLVGIIRQYFRNGYFPNLYKSIGKKYEGYKWTRAGEEDFTPSAAMVKAMLMLCALPLQGAVENHALSPRRVWSRVNTTLLQWDQPAPSYISGMGRPQLDQCLPRAVDPWRLQLDLTKVETNQASRLEFFEPELSLSQRKSFCIEVLSNRHPLKIAIVWTDLEGLESNGNNLNAEKPLVNDLDLIVTGGGQRRLGNEQFWIQHDGEFAGTAIAQPDRDNNWEVVVVPASSLQAGDKYRIEVFASFVRFSYSQDYAIVIIGDVSDKYDRKNALMCPECTIPKRSTCVIPSGEPTTWMLAEDHNDNSSLDDADEAPKSSYLRDMFTLTLQVARGRPAQAEASRYTQVSCQPSNLLRLLSSLISVLFGHFTASLFKECTERGRYSECLHVSCKQGYVASGLLGDNACVLYNKIDVVWNIYARMKFTGELAKFSAVSFEVALATTLAINVDRVRVTGSDRGSVIVKFKIAARMNSTLVPPALDLNDLRKVLHTMEQWRPGFALDGRSLLDVSQLEIIDTTPPPPYCGDLNGLPVLMGWCGFESTIIWNDSWGGALVWAGAVIVLIALLMIAISSIRRMLDTSMTPADASVSIKLAMAYNARELVRLTTNDAELMQTHLSSYVYERVGGFFRVWAFGTPDLHYLDWKSLKSQAKAFRMWADPTCVPGNAKNDRRWDMLMLGAGKVDYAIGVELQDLAHGGFAGQDYTDDTEQQRQTFVWNLEKDRQLRRAMIHVSPSGVDTVVDDQTFARIEELYFGGQGCSYKIIKKRWELIKTKSEIELHEAEFKNIDDFDPKVREDIMDAFNCAEGQKRLKRVAANMINKTVVQALQNWQKNFDDDKGRFWGLAALNLNPLRTKNAAEADDVLLELPDK